MAGGILIQRQAGEAAGLEDYLKTIIPKVEFKCFGMAFAEKGKMQITTVNQPPTADALIEAIAAIKHCPSIIHLGMYPATYSEFDLQPFGVLGENDDPDIPLLCAALVGEFNVQSSTSHLDVWHVAMEYLYDRINTNYSMGGNSLDKLLQSLQTKSFEADVGNQIKSAGNVMFLAATGETWVIQKGGNPKLVVEQPGWWSSNNLGWKPGTVLVTKPVDGPKRGSIREQIMAQQGKLPISEVTPPPLIGKPSVPSLPEKLPTAEPKDFPDKKEGPERSLIPRKVWQNGSLKDIRKWCNNIWGYVPKELVEATSKADLDFEKLYGITKEARAAFNAARKAAAPVEVPKPTGQVLQSEKKPLTAAEKIAARKAARAAAAEPEPAPVQEPSAPVVAPAEPGREFVPVPPPTEREGVEEMLIRAISDDGKKIPHPKSATERSFASFTATYGFSDLSEFILSKDDLYTLVQDYPVSAAMLLMEYQASREPAAQAAGKSPAKSVAA